MRDVLAVGALGVAALAALLGVAWVAQGNEFFLYRYFGPRTEAVRRDIFEQSKAYNQGMIQELQNMQFQYEQATPEHKAALASIILHRAADYDETKLPPDLYRFISGLRRSAS